ncbi:unnamed protein product [Heterobilharzia americana]|nr:unnamed protein product [Heterobilharzia americana]
MTNPMSNDNTIKEKHSTNRYIPSAKWPWPFKRYQHKRAHSADPLHNKEYSNNNAFSLSTACNYVYGITVSEYIHWYMIQSSMKRGLKLKELYCPMHSSIPLWAPDLRFEDVTSDLLISADLVHLFKFLGRGAFGSVFTGSAGNIDHHIRQRNLYSITRKQKPRILDDDHSMKVDEINNEDGNYQTHKIAVKICSPVHPNLDNSSVNNSSSFAVPNDITKLSEGSTSSNLRDAFALYRQDQRRWLQHPVETCLIAYQEIRAELNILLPITMNCMKVYQMKFSKHHPPFHIHSYQKHSTPTASNRSYKNMSKLYNGIQERRLTYGCFSKCLQKKTDNNSDNNKLISNMHLSQQKNNLLVCCGIIYPNPIGFLMPLAPLGNLSDYFTSLLSSYQDLLKSSVSSSSMMTMPTTTSLEHNELFLDHPLHPLTMMCVTNQLAKALAYLHHLSIIHRDVKSENVLIWSMPPSMMLMSLSTLPNNYNPSQVHIVLTDYGASRFMSSPDDGCRGYVGTTGYMAPEILEYLGEQTYNTKVDIYAMGILICEMIQLEQPYKKSSSILFRLAQEVISGVRPEIPSHFLKRCPRTLINLMTYCWESDSNKRPTAQQIVQLTNPWWPSSNEVVNTSNSNNNDINSLKIDHISFLSSKRNDRIHLSSNIKRSMNVFSNSTRQKSSFNTLSNIVLNGFSHIQLVYCIDALKIVTCALVDDCYNLWLGGYNYYAESSLDDEQYIRIGLLFLIPLTTDISSESSIVLASWPRLYVLKQYSQGIVGHDTCRKLSDWPIRLCWLSDGDSKLKYVRKDSANNKTPRTMVTCLTILGELRVYGFNYKTMEYICLLKIQLSQYSKLSTHSIDNEECENLFHGVKCMLAYMKYNYHQNQFHSQHHRRPSSPSTGCIHYILCLASPQICIVTVHILSSLMVKFEKTTFVNLDQPIHSGVILPEICDSDVWFSQNGGKLLCYTWNNALHEICSSSLSNCFKLRLSWFVPLSSSSSSSSESKSSSSSLVTHFLLDTSMSANQDDSSEDNVHIYVWTYLKPHGKLDCWSAVSQNLLQSISLTCHLDKPFSQNFSTSEMFGSIRAMEWLTLSSDILLITTHGYLIHINVTHINTDNKSSSMKATETMLTATSENSSNRLFHSSASSSFPSVLFNIHVFHYHGVMSDEDFVLIAPLIPTTSSTSYSLSRILTIGKGYLDPLACINPSSSSALYTNTVQMCYDGNSNNKALSNQMNTAKCFSQENYYLVKLFCDKFLFS